MICQYSEWCRAAGFSANTIKDRQELLMRVESDLGSLHKVTPEQLAPWLAQPKWLQQTRATYFNHLHGYLTWALKAGHISADPMLNLARPRVPKRSPKPAAEEHYRRILAEAPRWALAVSLARYAGLRAAEIARIQRDDVDETNLRILGKGGRIDTLPVHPRLWEMVEPMPAGNLVLSVRGNVYRPSGISHAFGVTMRKMGIPVTLHMFRHLFATSLLRSVEDGGAGANLRIVQELCRHESPATTAVYTLVTGRERRNAVFALAA